MLAANDELSVVHDEEAEQQSAEDAVRRVHGMAHRKQEGDETPQQEHPQNVKRYGPMP